MPAARYTKWTTPEGMQKIRGWVNEGKSDAEIARLMGTSASRLSVWRRQHPEIREALIRPVEMADGRVVDKHDIHKGEAPRKLNSIDKVRGIIDEWVERCRKDKRPLTVTGLALALGIGKETLKQYLREDSMKNAAPAEDAITGEVRFLTVSDVIKRAYLLIEDDLVNRAMSTNNPGGAIFVLKNWYGYADKKDIGVVQGGSSATSLSSSELDERLRNLLEKAK